MKKQTHKKSEKTSPKILKFYSIYLAIITSFSAIVIGLLIYYLNFTRVSNFIIFFVAIILLTLMGIVEYYFNTNFCSAKTKNINNQRKLKQILFTMSIFSLISLFGILFTDNTRQKIEFVCILIFIIITFFYFYAKLITKKIRK